MRTARAALRGEYSYNGLNWRIRKTADTDTDGSLDQERLMYYSANWQLLEEDVDVDLDQTADRHVQYGPAEALAAATVARELLPAARTANAPLQASPLIIHHPVASRFAWRRGGPSMPATSPCHVVP